MGVKLMAAILIGGLMDSVRRPVEVVCKQKLDLAPIPRHKMVGKIVAVLDLPLLLENATGIHVRSTEVTLTGHRTHNVQRLVDVVNKQKPELAPIPHHSTVVIIAVAWDHLCLQGSATTSNVKNLGSPWDVTKTEEELLVTFY